MGSDGRRLTEDTLVKFTRRGRMATQTDFVWPRPRTWAPVVRGPLEKCSNGYHLCRVADCLAFTNEELWLAEVRGDQERFGTEIVAAEARLVKRIRTWGPCTAQLCACDYAYRVWPIYRRLVPGDRRPLAAIKTARRSAVGSATEAELAAARAGARAAAWAAAWAAGWDTAEAAAEAAAGAAAGGAAWATAWAAAKAAVAAATRSAPGAAAEAAARAAAEAGARAAARVTAWAAAWNVDGDAAWAAERSWQITRLLRYLNGELLAPRMGGPRGTG